jgi:hypothetical protein
MTTMSETTQRPKDLEVSQPATADLVTGSTEQPAPAPSVAKPMSIDDLEKLLNAETLWEESTIEILPNGEIRRKGDSDKLGIKPLTMRENLGGEYAR